MTQRTITKILRATASAILLLLAARAIYAQSGGNVDLTWHVLPSGGASSSSGGSVTLGGSLGQFGAGTSSGGAATLTGGFWNPATGAPLAVTLAEFSAEQAGGFIRITWETASELENRGFNLHRGVEPAGPDRLLNATLIPSQSPGSSSGYAYTWEDRADLLPGTTYFYWLEDVDIHGAATMHGPVSVTMQTPTAVTLSRVQAGAAGVPGPAAGALLMALLMLAAMALLLGKLLPRSQPKGE